MIATLATLLMTRTSLGAKAAKLAAWGILIALLLIVLGVGKCTYDRSVIEKHSAKVEAADAKADAAATVKAEEAKGTIDAGNERAADAARDSTDPLADGFRSLRTEKAGSDNAAR